MSTSEENIARKITEMYLSGDFPESIEREAKQWLVSDLHGEEKDEVLWQAWNRIGAADERGEAGALRSVRGKLGMTDGQVHLRPRLIRYAGIAALLALMLSSVVWIIGVNDITHQPVELATVITTGEDEKRHSGLNDGTDLWLNAESSVVYTDSRIIELDGEGFFDVAKQDGERFSVHSRRVTATVTGTRFNFRSYAEEALTVISLYEGSLVIQAPDTVLNLSAGQEFVYDHTLPEAVVRDMAVTRPGWMRDIINFEDSSLGDILHSLEKIYGVRIQTMIGDALDDRMELKFEEGLSLSDVLMFMSEISGKFRYRIDSGKVYIFDIEDQGI